jgi:hypothetical protein
MTEAIHKATEVFAQHYSMAPDDANVVRESAVWGSLPDGPGRRGRRRA